MKQITYLLLFYNIVFLLIYLSNATIRRPSSGSGRYATNSPILNPDNEEHEANHILQLAEATAQKYYLKLRSQFLSHSSYYDNNENSEREFREFKSQLALNLSRFNYENLKHKKRQVERLSKLQLEGLPSNQYDNAKNLLKHMKSLSIQDNVNSIDHTTKLSYQQSILRKIQTSTDPDELLHYWIEWRNTIGGDARRSLIEYKKYYRNAATLNGHITPSKTWYLYYEDDNFLSELTRVMENLMPLYRELHAYIRRSIKERYDNKVPYHGPIPHHFMEQIMEQDWYSKSVFSVPYPHSTLPDVNQALNVKLINSTGLLAATIWFYETGLKLSPFPEEFHRTYAIPLNEHETGIECKSITKKFPPDYGIKYCPKLGFKKFLQMHQAVAKLEYYKESINLPLGLNDEACPGFSDAIGEAAVIAAGSLRHLDKLGVVEHYMYTTEMKMNRLFRMAVHTLFSVYQYFVNEKFWVDFLDGKITEDNMNCEYWKLQQEWAGVSPPEERNENTFDASYKFYEGISDEKSSTRSLISEILGYQFYKAFCKEQEQYDTNNDDLERTLSTCDFFGQPDVGKKMGDMMSKGSTHHWRDVMEILTHTRGLDASAMFEYYAPLFNWLRQDNKKHHVRTGWEKKDLCE